MVGKREHELYSETCTQISITEKIVSEVASFEDVSPTDLDPLYEIIDLNALDRLVQRNSNSSHITGKISFPYHGYIVTVHVDGEIKLTPKNE